jgi:hypothetical protein
VREHFFRGELLHLDLRERLRGIRCPVLSLAGELDPIVTIPDAEELAEALPPERLRFQRFPDAGHLLALEQPYTVLAPRRTGDRTAGAPAIAAREPLEAISPPLPMSTGRQRERTATRRRLVATAGRTAIGAGRR